MEDSLEVISCPYPNHANPSGDVPFVRPTPTSCLVLLDSLFDMPHLLDVLGLGFDGPLHCDEGHRRRCRSISCASSRGGLAIPATMRGDAAHRGRQGIQEPSRSVATSPCGRSVQDVVRVHTDTDGLRGEPRSGHTPS